MSEYFSIMTVYLFVSHAKMVATMSSQLIAFLETVLVAQKQNSFPCGQFTLFVLLIDSLLSATTHSIFTTFFQTLSDTDRSNY
jgi:hypothetical protein